MWIGSNFYAIFYLSHKAEILFGELYVLLQKKQELLGAFINKLTSSSEAHRNIAFELRELKKQIETEKIVSKRLLIEKEIDNKLEELSKGLAQTDAVYQLLEEILKVKELISRCLENHNRVISKLELLYSKKLISKLVDVFHVKKLTKV